MIRKTVKAALELGATLSGAATLARYALRDRVAILAYHNVVPDGEAGRGDVSLHLPLSRFRDQLDHLADTHQIVDLETAARAVGGRPRAVITFDDAYRGAVTHAFPELRRRGLPGVVFVSPGLLGETGLWWDELAEADRLTPDVRESAMRERQGRLEPIRRWAFPDGRGPSLPPSYGIATASELRSSIGEDIVVGAHGWDHACLPALEPSALRADLERTLAWVGELPGPSARWLALPYGEGSPAVAAAALAVGYEGVLEIRGGLWRPPGGRASVPRVNVPAGLSTRGLALRTSGLWP